MLFSDAQAGHGYIVRAVWLTAYQLARRRANSQFFNFPPIPTRHRSTYWFFFQNHHFHFPAQLVGFTLSDLLDKPLSQVSSLLPPDTCLQFLSRIGFSIPTARQFLSNVANSRTAEL